MGSSKKEKSSKKKKNRSRSRSPADEAERKHKKHKKDKDREKDKEREKDKKRSREDKEKPEKRPIDVEEGEYPSDGEIAATSPEKKSGGGGDSSLSIEETNKLRAKLGLKPLEVGGESTKSEEKKDVHKPAENLREKKQAEKLREKLKERQQKRAVEGKLKKVKGLADSDDDDTQVWVQKLREKQKQKEEAEKRAKLLEELEDEFGVGNLVEEDLRKEKQKSYSAKNLQGLKVEHDVDNFTEGRDVILTLKDQNVLDEENDDTLVNVNILDSERYKKNIELKKKKPGYNAYEDEELDEFGMPKKRNILDHYDGEIDGEKRKSFVIGKESGTAEERDRHAAAAIRARLSMSSKRLESLEMPAPQVASNFYTPEEMVAFKKPIKKVRKVRKRGMLTADELLAIQQEGEDGGNDLGSRNTVKTERLEGDVPDESIDDTDVVPENILGIQIQEPDEYRPVVDSALNRARRLLRAEKQTKSIKEVASQLLQKVKEEVEDETQAPGMVLHSTSEFCRTLGDLPTLGLSINEEELDEMDVDPSQDKEEYVRRGWAEVNADVEAMAVEESQPSSSLQSTVILDEEPNVAIGIGAALKFARSKGYIEDDGGKKASMSAVFRSMQAKNYTIEDKSFDDDKYSRRERYAGPLTDFKNKAGYKPSVQLEYINDSGHMLDQKEAFRYLSHKFHGKGSGKMKSEKREKKMQEKVLLTEPSIGDKPFDTLHKLQEKQKELQAPYVVLTGSKANATSLAKIKTDLGKKK